MRLKKIKYTDLLEDKKYNFLLPIGSLEQHGPYIPFGTDTYITDYIVNQAEKEFPNLIILPTLEFSRSQEHKEFFGTVYLSEETLEKVMFDICNSLYTKADNIFITSFHANDLVIEKFIKEKSNSFTPAKIINLEICNEEDDKEIKKLLNGPIDDHAGNTEISNMLIIDPDTVKLPSKTDKKTIIQNPFETDNIADKSKNGIADNHPEWITNKEIGQKTLDIYTKRMITNLHKYL